MMEQLNIWIKYLMSKRSEIADMDYRDALLAQVNIRIYRTVLEKRMVMVSLRDLKFLHTLERATAQKAVAERVQLLEVNKDALVIRGEIKNKELDRIMPSVSMVHVVKDRKEGYIAFEGNGRIAALKKVFKEQSDVKIEVEEYVCKNARKILYMLHRIRKLNGLLCD